MKKNLLLFLLWNGLAGVWIVYHNNSPHDNNPLKEMYVTQGPHGRLGAIDLRAEIGTEVFAIAQGAVIEVIKNHEYKGNGIIIEHTDGVRSIYYHLSEVLVCVNDTVSLGQNIGLSGDTGQVSGPCLHFAIDRRNSLRAL